MQGFRGYLGVSLCSDAGSRVEQLPMLSFQVRSVDANFVPVVWLD